jgi:hypothetical protein
MTEDLERTFDDYIDALYATMEVLQIKIWAHLEPKEHQHILRKSEDFLVFLERYIEEDCE